MAIRTWLKRSRGARYGLALLAFVFVFLAAALITSPLWLTPVLERAAPVLQARATALLGVPVHFDGLAAKVSWRPSLVVHNVVIGKSSRPAIFASRGRVQLSWLALLHGSLRPAFVGVKGLHLTLRKSVNGFKVVGFPHHHGPPFDWLSFLRKEHSLKLSHSSIKVLLSARRRLSIQQLGASWVKGIRGRTLQLAATVPGVCKRCALKVEFDALTFKPRLFSGAIGLSLRGLDLHAASALTKVAALGPLAGSVGGHFWTTWRHGDLDFVDGRVRLGHIFVPATSHNRPLALAALSGTFSLKRNASGFRFYAAHVLSDFGGAQVQTQTLYLDHRARRWRFNAQTVDLAQLGYLVRHVHRLPPALVRLAGLYPHGRVMQIRSRVRHGRHWHYHVHARFADVGMEGTRSGVGPVFSHVDGRLSATNLGGSLEVAGLRGLVRGPSVLPGPLTVRFAKAQVLWQKTDNGFSLELPLFHLVTSDGAVDATYSSVSMKGHSSQVALSAALHSVNVSAVSGFYPRSWKPSLRGWLTRTIRGGIVTAGHITLNGPLDHFPFRHGQGVFHVVLHVKGGRYRFLPRWPAAGSLNVTLTQNAGLLAITGTGRLGGMKMTALAVHAGPLGTPGGVASVKVQGHGPLGAILAVVLPHVHKKLRRFVPATLTGTGPADLTLALHIPFKRKLPLTLRGQVRLMNASLRYPWPHGVLHFRALHGRVAFTEKGPDKAHVNGIVLGAPFGLSLHKKGHAVFAVAHGRATPGAVQRLAGLASPFLGGAVAWHIHLKNGRKFRVRAYLNLKRAVIHLPYPAGKALGIPAVAHVFIVGSKAGTFVRATVPAHLAVVYRAPRGQAAASWVGVGSAFPPKLLRPGLSVGVRSSYLDASAWTAFIMKNLPHPSPTARPPTATPWTLRSLRLYVASLAAAGRPLGAVQARFDHVGALWQGVLKGPDVDGIVNWRPKGAGALLLRFQRLIIPAAPPGAHGPAGTLKPKGLPAVRLIVNSLTVGGRDFGHVAVDATPYPDGYRFSHIVLARPNTTVTGHGRWTLHGGLQESTFALTLKSHNVGQTLTAWGLPRQVAGAHATVHVVANWPGDPTKFSFSQLNAKLQFMARHGRFLQVRQGAGKLLGIFNVDSITRYLSLDFSNIFGRGFAFNNIHGKILVEQGTALTRAIHIDGVSANVLVSGQAGLAAHTFNLKVQVSPHLQNNVALASGLLGGPVAGAAVLLVQKIFASQINHGTRLTYFIRGPWKKPVIRQKADKD